MVISLMKINPKIQDDIIVFINGQNESISKEEEEKLIDLLIKYYLYDITVILEKYNDTYLSSFCEILNNLSAKNHIIFEPTDNEVNQDFFELINKLKCNIELSIKSEKVYNKISKFINKNYSLAINWNLVLEHFNEIENNPYINKIIISIDDVSKISKQQLEKLCTLKNVTRIEFCWENIKRKTFS